jgi:hypothetical protein
MPDLFKHFAELAVAAFDENDLVPGIFSGTRATLTACFSGTEETNLRGSGLHAGGARLATLDTHSLAKPIDVLFAGLTANLDEVGFLHAQGGTSQLVGKLAVVCDEQQPFAEVVEAPDRIESLPHLGEELHDGRPALRVTDGCDVPFGLVEHEVAEAFGALKQLSINTDVIACGIGLATEFSDRLAVHLHTALGNELFSVAAAGNAGLGEDLL